MIKRIVSLGMGCILMLNSVNIAFANDVADDRVGTYSESLDIAMVASNPELIDSDTIEQINKDLLYLENAYIFSSDIISIDNSDDNNIIYRYNAGGNYISDLEVSELDNGDVQITVTEGDISNVLRYSANGDLYCDDNLVASAKEREYSQSLRQTEPRAYIEYVTESCPYGSSKDYNVFDGQTEQSRIPLGTTIANITYTAFKTIILDKFINVLQAAADSKIEKQLVSVLGNVFTALLEAGRSENPKSTAVSFTASNFLYKTGSFRINGMLSAKQVIGTFYAEANFKGASGYKTFYECVDHT